METINDIPILDISPLLESPERTRCENIVRDMREACLDVGVFYVTGHGVSEEQTAEVFRESQRFFDLPADQKMKIQLKNSSHYRGYTGYKGEKTQGKIDLHEALDFARDIAPNESDAQKFPLFGPNQWPTHSQIFKHRVTEYFRVMSLVGKGIARGIFRGLGADDAFVEFQSRDTLDFMRLLYYPDQEKGQGIGEHVDYGVVTMIAQDNVGGLEVQKADGQWVEAPHVEGALPVVIGKMVQVTSNDLYKATRHRVHATGKKRYSIPFFQGPNFDTVVRPLDSLRDPDAQPKYEPYHYGESVVAAFNKSYGS